MKCKDCESNKNKKKCSKCNDYKIPKDFYVASSNIIHSDGKLGICIQCLTQMVDFEDLASLKTILRSIDRPFLIDEYEGSFNTAKNTLFGEYMRRLAMPQNKNKTWADSIFEKHGTDVEETTVNRTFIITDVMKKKWGNMSPEDYEWLENFYYEYDHHYATDTPAQINLYRNIAKVHLQAEKELSGGNVKQFKDLMELSSKLHNDGNIKPIQATGANDDKGLSTYGLWVKTIEQHEPCEYFKDKPLYEDYDEFKKYINKWFVRPFKNIFNISKDFNVED